MAKKDLSFNQLALMNWLLEKEGRFISTGTYSNSSNTMYFYETVPDKTTNMLKVERIFPYNSNGNHNEYINFKKKFGGRMNISLTEFFQSGFLTSHNAFTKSDYSEKYFAKLNVHPQFGHGESFCLPLKAMQRYWDTEGLRQYNDQVQTMEEKRKQVSRKIVIGRYLPYSPNVPKELRERWPKNIALPYPTIKKMRPIGTADVVKVTNSRVYVENIEITLGGIYHIGNGSAPNQYIDPNEIMIDYANEKLISKVSELDAEFQDDINRISEETLIKMLPLFENIDSRFKQKEAEHEDMLRELIENYSDNDRKP